MNLILLGLPGLYQNWLMSAVDPNSCVQLHGTQNFFCSKSSVKWMIKPGSTTFPEPSSDLIVINLYVKEHNFPWYLYNLFEKTYDIKIMIDSLIPDLIEKGHKFKIFDEFKEIFLKFDYNNINEVIGFFYNLFYEKNYYLYKIAEYNNSQYINIEYDDFVNPMILKNKLGEVPGFNLIHFNSMYDLLTARNQRYLNRKKDFILKLENNLDLDVIELGYIGTLAAKIFQKNINWANPALRSSILKNKSMEIYTLAKTLC